MTENSVDADIAADGEPIVQEPRDCCAPGRAAFLQTAPDRSAGA
ncbi:hypothetical protein ABCS02_17270 [Microbacterium sp. X-17]